MATSLSAGADPVSDIQVHHKITGKRALIQIPTDQASWIDLGVAGPDLGGIAIDAAMAADSGVGRSKTR